MTGGRSTEAAANNLAAVIGRARTEAIGLQKTSGVLFFMDQGTDRVAAVVVREVSPPDVGNYPAGAVFLDMAPNAEFTLLPPGVMLNTVDDANLTGSATPTRQDDGYIGFNPVYRSPGFNASVTSQTLTPALPARCGGVILFDGAGRLAVRTYRLVLKRGKTTELAKALTYDPKLDFGTTTDPTNPNYFIQGKTRRTNVQETQSSVGFVLFDMVAFRDAGSVTPPGGSSPSTFASTETDAFSSPYTPDEKLEEDWIDQNGTPYLVSRQSGALLRSR
jgi:hypothetical protein